MENNIKCPSCGTNIPLTEALTGQIEANLQAKYEKLTADASREFTRIRQELEDRKKVIIAEKAAISAEIDSGVAAKLQQERASIIQQERRRLQEEQAATTVSIMEDLKAKQAALDAARSMELDLRRQFREAEMKAQAAAFDAARKLDTERAAIKAEAARLADEAAALKLREKDNLLAQMSEQLEAMKRKAETGSQEAQGEAQEDILIETLSRAFPFDLMEEVKKGVKGGDIIQVVRNGQGKICGRILWESKNTKAFSKQWLEKVKSDQMTANANISVIMSFTLPEDFIAAGQRFGLYEGVWITDLKSATALTIALRQGIIEADKQRVVSANQDTLQAALYEYLTSKEAAMKISAIIDATARMRDDLNKERNAIERIWASREKQIDTASKNFLGFFGGIDGIVGQKSLPGVQEPVASLEAVAN